MRKCRRSDRRWSRRCYRFYYCRRYNLLRLEKETGLTVNCCHTGSSIITTAWTYDGLISNGHAATNDGALANGNGTAYDDASAAHDDAPATHDDASTAYDDAHLTVKTLRFLIKVKKLSFIE